jgi:hypothetical protein
MTENVEIFTPFSRAPFASRYDERNGVLLLPVSFLVASRELAHLRLVSQHP